MIRQIAQYWNTRTSFYWRFVFLYLVLGLAGVWSLFSAPTWLGRVMLALIAAETLLLVWHQRQLRYCDRCDRVLNRRIFERPAAWCECGHLADPAQCLIGGPGVIDLTNSKLPEHPQGIVRMLRLVLVLAINERCQKLVVEHLGRVLFVADDGEELQPLPPDKEVMQSLLKTLRANFGSQDDFGPLSIIVPVEFRELDDETNSSDVKPENSRIVTLSASVEFTKSHADAGYDSDLTAVIRLPELEPGFRIASRCSE